MLTLGQRSARQPAESFIHIKAAADGEAKTVSSCARCIVSQSKENIWSVKVAGVESLFGSTGRTGRYRYCAVQKVLEPLSRTGR